MAGNDTLKGGPGKDFFAFGTALDKGSNVDTVRDFRKSHKDKLVLDGDTFSALGPKADKSEVRFGGKAEDSDDYLIVKNQLGKNQALLFYDEDGDGVGKKVKFAVLQYKDELDFDHKSFKVITVFEDLDLSG